MDYRFNIALIYDFDGTLAPGNMQEYDFIPAVGKSNKEFWTEANTLAEEQDADMVLTYMARMLQEAKSKGLSLRREAFQESGRRVTLYKGVREWFERINAYGAARGIRILHYINSSGMKEIIEGTEIAHEFRKIYACSFLYDVDGIAYWPAVAVNYTNKTQFIFKINKGVESVFDSEAGEPLHPRKRAPHTVQTHDLRRRRNDRHSLHAAGEELRRPLHRRLQPRPEGGAARDGLADSRQPREPRLPGRLLRRVGHGRAGQNHHRQDRPRRQTRKAGGRKMTGKRTQIQPSDTTNMSQSETDAVNILFATNNAHKLMEVQAVLGPGFRLVTPRECGVTEEIPEEQQTLEGNASQKAHYLNDRTGLDCFADDTGLEVKALGGAPGVHSARYATDGHDFAANNRLLLKNLEGATDRRAQFRTVISLILNGEEHLFEGVVEGRIIDREEGHEGFGYDPLFIPDGYDKTFAQMSTEEKNEVSHRARAVRKLAAYLHSAGK